MVSVLPETCPEPGDEIDFSFASLPTSTPEQSAARRLARAQQSDRAAHAYRCAEVDGRDPSDSARLAAARFGGAT